MELQFTPEKSSQAAERRSSKHLTHDTTSPPASSASAICRCLPCPLHQSSTTYTADIILNTPFQPRTLALHRSERGTSSSISVVLPGSGPVVSKAASAPKRLWSAACSVCGGLVGRLDPAHGSQGRADTTTTSYPPQQAPQDAHAARHGRRPAGAESATRIHLRAWGRDAGADGQRRVAEGLP